MYKYTYAIVATLRVLQVQQINIVHEHVSVGTVILLVLQILGIQSLFIIKLYKQRNEMFQYIYMSRYVMYYSVPEHISELRQQ